MRPMFCGQGGGSDGHRGKGALCHASRALLPLLLVGLSLALLYFYAIRAFYQGLHVDEGLYTGAASHVANGDWFLSGYWVEKPPLPFYLMAAMLFLFGENIVGFHLAGLIFSILSFFLLGAWLRRTLGNQPLLVTLFLLLTFGVFVSPVFLMHGPTSFMEPFQLFFLLLFANYLERARSTSHDQAEKKDALENKADYALMAAFLCKQTTLLYFPMLLGYWIAEGKVATVAQARQMSRAFLHKTRSFWWVLLIALFTYKQKFSLISTFQLNFASQASQMSLTGVFQRLPIWFSLFSGVFGRPFASLLFLLSCSGALFLCGWAAPPTNAEDRQSLRSTFWILFLPFWIHLGVLWLAPVRTYDRYLYILVPQGIALIAACLRYLSGPRTNRAKFTAIAGSAVVFVIAICSTLSLNLDFHSYDITPPEFTEATEQVLEEIPRGSIVHTDSNWLVQPFQHRDRVQLGCVFPDCYAEQVKGFYPSIPRQFLLLRWEKDFLKGAFSNTLYQRDTIRNDWQQCSFSRKQLLEPKYWYDRLRMRPSQFEIRIATNPDFVPRLNRATEGWNEIPALPGQIQLKLNRPFLFDTITLDGEYRIARKYKSPRSRDLERDTLGYHIRRIQIDKGTTNFAPLAPIIWGGYFIPLFGVDCAS